MKIEIDGKLYKTCGVVPYQQAGRKAKFIETEAGEKVAVSDNGKWRFWTVEDRLGLKTNYTGQ